MLTLAQRARSFLRHGPAPTRSRQDRKRLDGPSTLNFAMSLRCRPDLSLAADTSGLPHRNQRNPYRATAQHSRGETAGLPAVRETVPRQMPLPIDHYGRADAPSSGAECSPVGNHRPPDGRLTRAMAVSSGTGHRAPGTILPARTSSPHGDWADTVAPCQGRHRKKALIQHLARDRFERMAMSGDAVAGSSRSSTPPSSPWWRHPASRRPSPSRAPRTASAEQVCRHSPRKRPPPRPRRPDRHGRTLPPPGTRCIRMASSCGSTSRRPRSPSSRAWT